MLQSSKAWYTQHHSFDAWTFERFDGWLSSLGKRGFYRGHTLPKMKDAILTAIKAARGSLTAGTMPRNVTREGTEAPPHQKRKTFTVCHLGRR